MMSRRRLRSRICSNSSMRVAALVTFAVSVCASAESATTTRLQEPLVRTRIEGSAVCSLTGRWLTADISGRKPVRAWAGIVEDKSGGPAVTVIRQRFDTWQRQALYRPADEPNSDELQARQRHFAWRPPRYFDAVLLQLPSDNSSSTDFCWIVDFDVDGNLNDESRLYFTRRPEEVNDRLFVDVKLCGRRPRFSFHESRALTSTKPPPNISGTSSGDRTAAELPAGVAASVRELHQLDTIQSRKLHLEKVVEAADRVIAAVRNSDSPQSLRSVLTDALYRKGRALGYMELPDVAAVKPVKDPVELQRKFEATFQELDRLTDTTAPQYILLRIRRERRLGRRGGWGGRRCRGGRRGRWSPTRWGRPARSPCTRGGRCPSRPRRWSGSCLGSVSR